MNKKILIDNGDTGISPIRTFRNELNNLKILVVDNSRIDRKLSIRLLKIIIKSDEIVITVAENGQEAVDKSGEQQYDLILTDINMPKMDGIEAAGLIRQKDNGVVIITQTANVDREKVKKDCAAAGVDEIIFKPVLENALRELIIKHQKPDNREG
ncbi:response regulator [Candidatus Margulisiibacteriota bacterium]